MFTGDPGKKLEKYAVSFPGDYSQRFVKISQEQGMEQFASALANSIDSVRARATGRQLNAAQLLAVFVGFIGKMAEQPFSKPEILQAINLIPRYISIVIPDETAQRETVAYFNHMMEKTRKALEK